MKRADFVLEAARPSRGLAEPPTQGRADAFGVHLRRELHARNWTVRYLALRAGVDHSTISRLMQGGRMPTLSTARRLHAALGGPDPLTFFGGSSARADPVRRVEEALRSDPSLDRAAVRQVLELYMRIRRSSRVADAPRRVLPAATDRA